MKNKKIYAIVGMCGSGKSEVIKYLEKKYNWPTIYIGEATFSRIKKEKLEINYNNEKKIREKIRKEMGMGAYAKLILPKLKKLLEKNDTVVIESLYSWSEYKILKQKYPKYFKTIAVFASPQIRFKRLTSRKKERPMKNIKEFIKRDYSEIENIEKGGPIARADHTLINEKNLKNLHKQIDNLIKKYEKQGE